MKAFLALLLIVLLNFCANGQGSAAIKDSAIAPVTAPAFDRMAGGPKPRESSYFKTGEKTPLFKTSDIDGNKIDLRDSSGRIIVLNFWFINCGPCRREIPDLNALADSLGTDGRVKFYGIALDGKAQLRDFLGKLPFHYTIIDNGYSIANKYGIKGFPTHVIIDGEGKVYFHTTGLSFNTVYWLKKSINELLSATKP